MSGVIGLVLLALTTLAPPAGAPGFDPDALDGVGNPRSDLHLEPRRDGSYVYRDADSEFRAVVHADGSVEYLRRPADLRLTFLGIDLLPRSRRSESATPTATPDPPLPPQPGTGDPTHDPGSYGPVPVLIGFGGRMPGLTDMVQRRQQFAAKARFLDDTAQLRRELARQVSERRTRDRLGSLGAELSAIWSEGERPAEQRRALLFQRWDECAEASPGGSADETTEDDARREAAGERGRRQIEAFVQRHAPPGSPLAFTAAELERLNARRHSRQRFDPYSSARAPGQTERSSTQ